VFILFDELFECLAHKCDNHCLVLASQRNSIYGVMIGLRLNLALFLLPLHSVVSLNKIMHFVTLNDHFQSIY